MSGLCGVLLLTVCCVLQAKGQLERVRSAPTILRDECVPEDSIADHAENTSATLALIAQSIINGTRSRGCLDSIYLMTFTGSTSRNAGSNHAHDFEVVGATQTRYITLPDRPGDYERHQGDIWKLGLVDDLGFLPGTCLKLCAVEAVRLAAGGNNGWLVDSAVTFGCINEVGCSLLTLDLDVHRWIDGNRSPDSVDLPLTLATKTSCV